ncbi:hypothetical protein FUAX_31570 [Fulvitalea axinellae]|uniref:Tol-pal system protein YbgF n=1 Tax=Fulvitalea axinellae TaxID=1182444 RepID=A0AAU9DE25_9BACT|nr:hypothetical protein FUAX_31570 [Fulvitalea axinellae]
MRWFRNILIMITFCATCVLNAGAQVVENSRIEGTMLLTDLNAQIASTEMLNSIYGYDFDKMEQCFAELKEEYGWHPMPYFLRGLAEWWKIEPNIENKAYDKRFLAYMDTSIALCKGIYKIDRTKVEASFFLAASHAFKGRLLGERKQWRKAATQARLALKYMEECYERSEMSPELLFGDGLYNYFVEWIPENYAVLRPIMLFFRNGDKEKGIEQLREVANNAFYTRTEAQFFLLRILNLEGKHKAEVLRITGYLHKLYPENPVFHRYYARALYATGQHTEMKAACEEILQKIDSASFGYGPNAGRYAAFFLGQYHEVRLQFDKAKENYLRVLEFVKENGYYESGYHLYALLSLEEMAARDGNKKEAEKYFKTIRKYAKRNHGAFKKGKKIWKKAKRSS